MDTNEQPGFAPQPESEYTYNPAAQAAYQAAGAAPCPGQAPTGGPAEGPVITQPAKPKKKRNGWIVAGILLAVVALLFCISSCSNHAVEMMLDSVNPSAVADATTDSVAIIEITGEIGYDGSECSPEGFKDLLDRAEGNPLIKAVVLRVNSGGGTATAGEEMTEYLKDFSKPVVVSCASMNASAAYEISSQADYIYTARSSAVGAIGTALEMMDYSKLLAMLGISADVITSADSKDSSYGYRPLTEEERAYYQRQVDQINQMFIENVAEGRSMTVDQVKPLATGLTFTGVDAVSNGLADEIGTLEDACQKAATLAGMKDYDVVYLSVYQGLSLSSLLSMDTNTNVSVKDIASALKELS